MAEYAVMALGLGRALGGYGSYKGAGRAAKASKLALLAHIMAREGAKNKANELYTPFLGAGQTGLAALEAQKALLLSGDMSKFVQSPGYQFQLEQGREALNKSLAAKGGLLGGGGIMEGLRYSQGLASQEFNNYINQLMGLSTTGINTGLAAAGNIVQTYSPDQFVPQLINTVGQASAQQTTIPWATGAQILGGAADMLNQQASMKYVNQLLGPGTGQQVVS